MITLTVKTLDAQNHTFEVEDDITVEQFKNIIADTVNVPPNTQRIIYCGRVLQDNSKLSDYDVNGKVVHLVQRPPPEFGGNANRTPSPTPSQSRRVFVEPGHTMYLGSMAFPANLMESQGFVPPPPTHSLAGSRLNVARRMLLRAEAVIRTLENPSARPSEHTPPEDVQEEVTPVIEARVIVPSNNAEPFNEAMVLSAVRESLIQATGAESIGNVVDEATIDSQHVDMAQSNVHSDSSTPDIPTPVHGSTENLAMGDQRQDTGESSSGSANATNGNTFPENASRTSEMAELLTMLSNLQLRFAPFLERYQNFMQEDPVIAPEDMRSTQTMLTRVSGVLHFLAHACHSLSDIIIRVRTPTPRPLLCRPILIQHSAVVQAGIPIQVEAQINLSTDRRQADQPSSTAPATTTTGSSTTTTSTAGSADSTGPTATPPNSSEDSPQPTPAPGQVPQSVPHVLSFPFLPGASMRLQPFPIEVRSVGRPTGAGSSGLQNNNNASSSSAEVSSSSVPTTGAAPLLSTVDATATNTAGGERTTSTSAANAGAPPGGSEFNGSNFNNSNVEFYMEVTPEVIRGTMNGGPPPEFLQSLMQMAGQIISRAPLNVLSTGASTPPTSTVPQTTGTTGTSTGGTGTGTGAGAAAATGQTRGSAHTQPTTSTHTRTTARPHVHLAQQAMQGGFDPFLPCNSHHLPPNRRVRGMHGPMGAGVMQAAAAAAAAHQAASTRSHHDHQHAPASSSAQAASQPAAGTNQQRINLVTAIMNGILNNLRNEYRGTPPTTSATSSGDSSSRGGESSSARTPGWPPAPAGPSVLNNVPLNTDPTIARVLHLLPPYETYNQGESLITDLIMMLLQELTLGDILTLSTGQLEPLHRLREQISTFFITHVRQNRTDPESIDLAVDRIVNELRPFLENFSNLPVRDNIDMVRSAETLFRSRLPNIISLASSLNTGSVNSVRLLVDQCTTTMRQLWALTSYVGVTGQRGVQDVLDNIIVRYMQGIPRNLQQWAMMHSRMHLRQFMSNLAVPNSILQPYIVRKDETRSTPAPDQPAVDLNSLPDLMEIDDQEASGSGSEVNSPPLPGIEEDETLPNVVIGSESWHSQVPSEWVPIITRDSQRQRRQSSQPAFSDAYLSGMPSKRRKIINSNKPQGTLPHVISDSIRRAVTTSGLSSVVPVEDVAQAAGASSQVQSAYRSLLRSTVQAAVRDNEDFTAERFPYASAYFAPP